MGIAGIGGGIVSTPVAIGLDLGTTSVSAVALDAEVRLLDASTVVHEADVTGLLPGHAEQDPESLLRAAGDALRRLEPTIVDRAVCLGLTGQMHGVLLVDDDGEPLTNLVTWQDRRANSRPSGDEPTDLERFVERCSPDAIQRTGTQPSPGFLGTTLAVWAATDAIPETARRAVFLADWIAARFTEAEAVTDASNAASSGLFDVSSGAWCDELVVGAGFDRALLPPVRPAGEPIGTLTVAAAELTGLPSGIPVCNAIGDNQAAVIGSVPYDERTIQVNVGTGGQINWAVDEFVRVPGMDTRPLPPGRLMLVGAGLAGGDAFAWVARTARAWARTLGVDCPLETVYERLQDEIARVSPEDVPDCTPTFRGTRVDPLARGSFTAVTNENFELGHVGRAVLRGIVDGFHDFLVAAGTAGPSDATRIIGTGNAIERNPALVEELETRFGLPVWSPVQTEAAACGAALLAGANTGMWPDLETATRRIPLRRASVRDRDGSRKTESGSRTTN